MTIVKFIDLVTLILFYSIGSLEPFFNIVNLMTGCQIICLE